ncbi:hypothetical protein DFH05DRAFT_106125 [Lentinula detonsa]|uniref:RRM domain-containing protein n=1 Tax=Lentinula detonsa TaxID=2804962 RepID=A0A9W8U2U5_9AGAR|nr:hypothetical protein DFH05DRAFT_106125 [Lentinula detonsa]
MPPKLSVRTWGTRFDSLPPSSPPLVSPNSSVAAATEDGDQPLCGDSPAIKKAEKTPHDASVFVGSLPINIDLKELGVLLSQHLAEFAQVKAVKVIHDSKGGVCAFVQCEDANSASKLIQTLQSSASKPFFGRILRFEAARAHRSLLISYRTPTQKIISTDNDTSSEKTVELTLPSAMRINKFRNSKSAAIFYNDEAIHMERQAGSMSTTTYDVTFFKAPVLCDAATLKAICGFFGPLEYFQSSTAQGSDGSNNEDPPSFPAPHDAPRKPDMDQGCFEVKWTHRDNCMSALTTLRRVPHLTVTWAHAAPDREAPHSNGPNHPYPIFPRMRAVSSSGHSPALFNGVAPRYNVTNPDDWDVVSHPPSMQRGTKSRPHTRDCNPEPVCLETDFPPLVDQKTHLQSDFDDVWIENKPAVDSGKKDEESFDDGSSFNTSPPGVLLERLSDVHPLRSNLNYRSVSISASIPDASQELELQLTPALARSPVTPKTPGFLFPPTPTSFHGERPLFSKSDHESSYNIEGMSSEQILDPTTLFVGGLEMRGPGGPGAWDEAKVYHLFEKYGGVESVNVIRPSSGKAAFAFVKFGNAEGPARAVAELHNRVVEGRPLRVQLRDCNPSRSPFRAYRGRGRYPYSHGHQFRQNAQSELKRDKSVDASSGESASDIKSHPELPSVEPVYESVKAVPDAATVHHRPDTEHFTQTQGPEAYREWYEVENQLPAPAATPPVGASYTPEGGLGTSYPLPAFYAPGSWLPPHVQYPLAFYPPMYAVAPNLQPPRYSGSSGSDLSGPVSGPPSMPPVPWNTSVNYGYIPYQGITTRPPDQTSQNQPPVTPAGFFRDEAGTLLAVYPTASISQYIANNPNQSSPPPAVAVAVPATVPSPIPVPSVQAWAPPGPPTFGLGHGQLPPRVAPFSNQSSGWIDPAQLMNQGHHVHSLPPPLGMPMIGAPPFRGGFHGGIGQTNGHKRQGRREHFHGKRNGGPRGRRSSIAISDPHVDRQMNGNQQAIGDWTHWPEARQDVG